MPEKTTRPRRPRGGRPSLEEAGQLRDRILDAAAELFARHGYGETSVEAIAALAGVGKLTVYRRFRDKDTLFQATALRLSHQRHAEMGDLGEREGGVREVLLAAGRQMLAVALAPQSLAFQHILLAEAARLPDLCARIFQGAPDGPPRVAPALFRRLAERGLLSTGDPDFLGQQFIQAVIGAPRQMALLGAPPMSAQARDAHVRKAVDLFLGGAAGGN